MPSSGKSACSCSSMVQIRVEDVERLLREVAHRHAGAELHRAVVRRQGAGDHLEQRGFPRAVLAHHRPALAAADGEREAVVHDAAAVRLFHVHQRRDLLARPRGRTEVELHELALLGELDLVDLVERLHAALHLRRLGGVGREAIDEPLLLGEHGLLARIARLAVGLADRALALVVIVVPGVDGDLAAVDLGDLRHDPVHELAVVRGHEQGTRQPLEERFEPEDRLDVEVVGGLVHQQHVGPAEQHARHADAHLPPARQRADVAVDPLVVEAEAVQHFARLRLERVASEVVVLLLHLAEALEDLVHVVGRDPGRPWPAAAREARGGDRRAGRCPRWPRRGPCGPPSLRRPGGSSRSSAFAAARLRRRRASPRRRSCERAWSCRRRSGPTRPTFSPGLN